MLQEEAEDRNLTSFAADIHKIESAGRKLLELVDRITDPYALSSTWDVAPIINRAPEPEPHTLREESEVIGSKPAMPGTILVVDDSEANRDMLARRLKLRGYSVSTAADGREALRAVEAGGFDLVLLDVMMPEISGFDVLGRLRESRSVSDLPVIMATALDASEDVVKALKLGANDYVTKPLDFAVVIARVETQLALKRAKDQVVELNRNLGEAQKRISALVESSAEALNDVRSWSAAVAKEIAQAIGAEELVVWVFDEERPDALTATTTTAPDLSEVRLMARRGRFIVHDAETLIPVCGLSGDVHGALVVRGLRVGELASKVLASFAHQLGGTLELKKMRKDLKASVDKRRASRQNMLDRGIDLLRICPSCRRCFDQRSTHCPNDNSELPEPSTLPFRIAERHRLIRVIGEGGMGTVFSARDERLERDVAVKIIKSEHFNNDLIRLRFEHEARSVARINHPGVVAVYDSGELEDLSLFIVMELLRGCDLAEIVNTFGRGTPKQVSSLLRQVGSALSAAHAIRLVHRDIKPENIFLTPHHEGFRTKVLDFGVAKELAKDRGITQTGTIIGTPLFMCPEQILGKPVDTRGDLYSLAAVAYLALTGRLATTGETLPEILLDVVQGTPPPVPSSLVTGLPCSIDKAFASALAKSPDDRPDDVESWVSSFVDDLEKAPADIDGWKTDESIVDLGKTQRLLASSLT